MEFILSHDNENEKVTDTGTYEGNSFKLIILGEWKHDRREGKGKMSYLNGSSFEGTWKNDQPSNGTLTMTNGCLYLGDLKNGKFHGFGQLK